MLNVLTMCLLLCVISLGYLVHVCVQVPVTVPRARVCVCVCVWERERERGEGSVALINLIDEPIIMQTNLFLGNYSFLPIKVDFGKANMNMRFHSSNVAALNR